MSFTLTALRVGRRICIANAVPMPTSQNAPIARSLFLRTAATASSTAVDTLVMPRARAPHSLTHRRRRDEFLRVVMSAEETNDAPALDVDEIMRQLCDEFKARNGREATADEMKQWQEQLLEAMKDGGLQL
jgi:hypothetical protein